MIEILEARIAPAVVLNKAGLLTAIPTVPDLVATDTSGNIFVVGSFTGSVKPGFAAGDPTLTTADPAGDLYLACYAPDFTLLWQNSWGGTGLETASAITVDGSGNLFIAGSFSSTSATFSNGGNGNLSVDTGVSQAFILKVNGADGQAATGFNNSGAIAFGNGSDPSHATGLAIDINGQLVVAGDFTGNSAAYSGQSFGISATTVDGFIGRLDAGTGVPDINFNSVGVKALSLTTTGNDTIFKLAVGPNGDYFVGLKSDVVVNTTEFFALRLSSSAGNPVDTWGASGFAGIATNVNDNAVDFTFDQSGNVVAVQANGSLVFLSRYNDSDGQFDTNFANTADSFLFNGAGSTKILTDANGGFYIGGEQPGANYVAHFTSSGVKDTNFGKQGILTFGSPLPGNNSDLGMALGANGSLILKDAFTGNPDVDPGAGVKKLLPTSPRGPSGGGFLLSVDPNAIMAGQSFTLSAGVADGHEAFVVVTLTGPGYLHVNTPPEGAPGEISSIELFNTTLASNLTVKVLNPIESVSIEQILTMGANQHMGSISLGAFTVLGDGLADASPDLLVTGKINSIVLGDVNANTLIKLGQDLPYNIPNDTTTPDTYNNHPNLTIDNIRDNGVLIDVTGDGTAQGIGGGGFGKVVIGRWETPGLLRTTQSIGSFTVLEGNFGATLEVDKFHVGENTTANVGTMTVQNGAWGSSGTDIEGNIGVFDVDAFLAGASITAGSVSKVVTDTGEFNGTLTLTDTDAKGVATFTVGTNFTGHVVSAAPLKKLVIKGDFMGSLSAPSIASITAFSFLGTTTDDTDGDANRLNITTTAGLLGLITSKSGIIKDYELVSPVAFSGMKVVLNKLNASTVGIENVNIAALSIGPITVQLSANATVAGVDLTGIKNSSFISDGKMGAVTVKLSGASGNSLGLDDATFGGTSIGNVSVSVTKGTMAGATARAVDTATLASAGSIGKLNFIGDATMDQVNDLAVYAAGKIASLTVKSKGTAFGTLTQSIILAGQNFDPGPTPDKKALAVALATASFGAISISGSLINTILAGGSTIGAVNVGSNMTNSTVVAGALLGGDHALGGGDDVYHRAGQIASVVVKGKFTQSTLAAGVNAHDGIFGNGDDTAGVDFGPLVTTAAIKSITIGSPGVAATPPANAHNYGIEAQVIGKLTVAGQKIDLSLGPVLLDDAPGGEGTEDVVVRLI